MLRTRDISSSKLVWALQIGQGPMSHSNTCKIKIFDGPFQILMGPLKIFMGPRILKLTLGQNKHWIRIACIEGPAKNQFNLSLTLKVFTQNGSGPSQKYPCTYMRQMCNVCYAYAEIMYLNPMLHVFLSCREGT